VENTAQPQLTSEARGSDAGVKARRRDIKHEISGLQGWISP
jgi:hypothetical protein